MQKYHNFQGIKIVQKNPVVVDSLKFNADENYNKPLNEVSEEIQRRKNVAKTSGSA